MDLLESETSVSGDGQDQEDRHVQQDHHGQEDHYDRQEHRVQQHHYPDLSVVVREGPGPGAGTGTGVPDADGDRDRAHKAPTTLPTPPPFLDGVVPSRDLRLQHQREHPELVEDLKTFLGIKAPTAQSHQDQLEPSPNAQEAVELTQLADPYHTKPSQPPSVPQPACAQDAEAMSAYDGQGPGSEAEPQAAGDADSPASALDCASPGTSSPVAGPSRRDQHDHDGVDGDPRRGASAGQCAHDGPTSVEDKCLECCVYYGVMCCQCTIS